jgi:hypothetical protein
MLNAALLMIRIILRADQEGRGEHLTGVYIAV